MERQLSLINLTSATKEDPQQVAKELCHSCSSCRLGVVVHPQNRGLIHRGNPLAKIAVIGEAPGDTEMEAGLPLVGNSGQLWEKWARYCGLDTKLDCYLTNVVQCQPDKVKNKQTGRMEQRPPDEDEIRACFPNRCLRLLRAMPNLEVVITLGWVAAAALLGGEPSTRSHENKWFKTSLLPGVAVYCLVHPAFILREPSPEKSGRVQAGLDMFRREYLSLKKVNPLVRKMEEEEGSE